MDFRNRLGRQLDFFSGLLPDAKEQVTVKFSSNLVVLDLFECRSDARFRQANQVWTEKTVCMLINRLRLKLRARWVVGSEGSRVLVVEQK